jgi:hypothetical protein
MRRATILNLLAGLNNYMDKTQIISFIETQIKEGRITREELEVIAQGMPGSAAPVSAALSSEIKQKETTKDLSATFYSIGATIAIIGVTILVAQHWSEIGFGGRILVTLVLSFACYVAALVMKKPDQDKISQVLFVISASLAPLGAYVLLQQAGVRFEWATQIGVAGALTIIYAIALWISRKNILVLVATGFGTWLYYAALFDMLGNSYDNSYVLKWATMLLGLAYFFIAHAYQTLSKTNDSAERISIYDFLNGIATLSILGAGITVGGGFDVLYIALIFAAFYGSVFLKSRSMLMFGALFLMAHVIKLTYKYFIGSVSWPVALIVVGFLIIGVGYFTLYLSKKYFPAAPGKN